MLDEYSFRPDGTPMHQMQQGQQPHGQFPQHHPFEEGYLMPYMAGHHNFGQYTPNMRPPEYIPRKPFHHPGSIRTCVNRFTYIWFHDGRNFWAWIAFVSHRTIYGYRFNGHRWIYFEGEVNDVETFVCVR
ncbi:MAG: hypothetical protein Q8920_14625 [Bacillota bacterium]|nr:hypothetical protein [Bacillota bacterium]